MIRLRAAVLVPAVLTTALLCMGAAPASPALGGIVRPQALELRAGDVITLRQADGWHVVRVVAVDPWPDGTSVAHVLTYDVTAERPSLAAAASLPVRIMHAPVRAESYGEEGWERLGNTPVTPGQRAGFDEYLKHTDFPRYLTVTGQDAGQIVRAANEQYLRGNSLSEAGDHQGAIAAYDRAIDLFPLFFEAIDNRAFSYMDLGRYDLALEGFEASLRVEPDGIAAFFSRGECLLRLGRLDEAEMVFLEGQQRFPAKSSMFTEFLQLTRQAQAQARAR